jgi:hypothetical protein
MLSDWVVATSKLGDTMNALMCDKGESIKRCKRAEIASFKQHCTKTWDWFYAEGGSELRRAPR